MSDVYISLMNAYDNQKNIDYFKLKKLIDYHKSNGCLNFFLGSYFFEKWSMSIDEKIKSYETIIKAAGSESKVIINLLDSSYKDQMEIIDYINNKADNVYLSINMPMSRDFSSSIVDQIAYLDSLLYNISKKFYISVLSSILKLDRHKKVIKQVIKKHRPKGVIFNPDFLNDADINHIINGDHKDIKYKNKLEIIFNSDQFLLKAFENDSSLISKYANIFAEDIKKIKAYYDKNQLDKAKILQESLNDKTIKLKNIGELQSIKYLFKLKNFDLGGTRKPYYQLTKNDKEKLKKLNY